MPEVDERHMGWTPMMGAAELGHFNVVPLLLDPRADVNARNNKGRSAVSLAAAPATITAGLKLLAISR